MWETPPGLPRIKLGPDIVSRGHPMGLPGLVDQEQANSHRIQTCRPGRKRLSMEMSLRAQQASTSPLTAHLHTAHLLCAGPGREGSLTNLNSSFTGHSRGNPKASWSQAYSSLLPVQRSPCWISPGPQHHLAPSSVTTLPRIISLSQFIPFHLTHHGFQTHKLNVLNTFPG